MMTIENTIRRNKDGLRNLADLRHALKQCPNLEVHRKGGNWYVLSLTPCGAWEEYPCRWYYDERRAIEFALDLHETP